MHAIIAQKLGRIHHAACHPVLAKTRPVYCWIPEEFFDESGLQRSRYLVSRWPGINCGANPLAVGSHVIPDPDRPVNNNKRCPILAEFLQKLETIATIKAPAAA